MVPSGIATARKYAEYSTLLAASFLPFIQKRYSDNILGKNSVKVLARPLCSASKRTILEKKGGCERLKK